MLKQWFGSVVLLTDKTMDAAGCCLLFVTAAGASQRLAGERVGEKRGEDADFELAVEIT